MLHNTHSLTHITGRLRACRAAQCAAQAEEVLSAGTLAALVKTALVRHQVTVQASPPPIVPALSLTCGGLVGRVGAAAPETPPISGAAAPDNYEAVASVLGIRATLNTRLDTSNQLSAASIAYSGRLSADIEGGFKRARISGLLQADAAVAAVVRGVHDAAALAWLHPGDGDALLASWARAVDAAAAGGAAAARLSAEDAQCAPFFLFLS